MQTKSYPATFIDYKLAIGMLVVAGFKVEWYNNAIVANNEQFCVCYKDGTTYKVKHEHIADYIDENAN